MIHSALLRTQLLTATVPFVVAASQLSGVRRIALFGSLTTTKTNPKDVDLLLTVADDMNLQPLATLGRKLSGRVTLQAHGNYGVDLFVVGSQHRYLGRLCHHSECPGLRICAAAHCGKRPYLRDDLRSVTLEPGLVALPPLELWPKIIVHSMIPADVERSLLQPLMDQLDLEPMEQQIIPQLEGNKQGQNMGNYTCLTISTDGASRSNPGPAAVGIHMVDETTSKTVVDLGVPLGIATNNVAEYQAVLHAIEWLLAHKDLLADDIHISFQADSRLVVSQLSGRWGIRDPKMRVLVEEVFSRLRQLPGTHTFTWIRREENRYADRLANDTLDRV